MDPLIIDSNSLWYRFTYKNIPARLLSRVWGQDPGPNSSCEYGATIIWTLLFAVPVFYLFSFGVLFGFATWLDLMFFSQSLGVFAFVQDQVNNGDLSLIVFYVFGSFLSASVVIGCVIFYGLYLAIRYIVAPVLALISIPVGKVASPAFNSVADWWNKICRPVQIKD